MMNKNTENAKKILSEGGYTVVLTDGEKVLTSYERGVKPLLSFLESGEDFSRFSAADKVVGSAAAYLYVLMNVKEVYAGTLSEGARKVFGTYSVPHFCGDAVPFIINRKGDGMCPMESAVKKAVDAEDALKKILERIGQ